MCSLIFTYNTNINRHAVVVSELNAFVMPDTHNYTPYKIEFPIPQYETSDAPMNLENTLAIG